MNFLNHFYGVESFNYESAKVVGKGISTEKLKEGLLSIKEYFTLNGSNKYRGTISLILGLPHETTQTLKNTRTWIKKHWIDQSVSAWVLEIPPDDSFTSHSKLSYDYKKYGYSKYQNLSVFQNKILKNYFNENSLGLVINDKNYFVWKNKDLDLFAAIKIKEKFNKLQAANRTGCFDMLFYQDIDYNALDASRSMYVHNLVCEYKRKKLN
jgi:radical SAM superfamily enzyme YgiQ (UPF0313 family)